MSSQILCNPLQLPLRQLRRQFVCLQYLQVPSHIQRRYIMDIPPQPPASAPKPSANIKAICAAPDYHIKNCIDRNYADISSYPTQIVKWHEEWTDLQKSLRGDRERHNSLSAQLRNATKTEKEFLLKEARELKAKITNVEKTEVLLEQKMRNCTLSLPNSTHPETPLGTEPKILGYINENLAPKTPGGNHQQEVKSHIQIGTELKLLDFADAGVVSGWGWYYLLNEAVLLEQALINYSLSLALKRGWCSISPPSIVYTHIAHACGFQPRDQNGEKQIYYLDDLTHALAGTAEIPLAGMHANKTFGTEDLPIKVIGVGRSYRAEAGARGAESKGLYRVHEFTKVEFFAWTHPGPQQPHEVKGDDESSASTSHAFQFDARKHKSTTESVFDEMLELQTNFIASLGLHARILEMPTTDLGASASRKIDIEVYIPSRATKNPWGEVSSLSNCTDYQSRRLNTRVKLEGGTGKKTTFSYTLNGTACAIPRILIAILENGWSEERGGVVIPEVLRPYMGGMEFIARKK